MGNWNTPNSEQAYPLNIGESYADFYLNNTQIRALKSSPITIVPAPGADRALIPKKLYIYVDTTGGVYTSGADDGGQLLLYVDNSAQPNQIYSLLLTGSPEGGSFTMLNDVIVNFNDDEATIQAAIDGSGTGPDAYVVTGGFDGGPGPVLLETTDHLRAIITGGAYNYFGIDPAGLTGGTAPDVAVAVTQQGGRSRPEFGVSVLDLENPSNELFDWGGPVATQLDLGSGQGNVIPNGGIALTGQTSMDHEFSGGDGDNFLRGRVWYQNVPFPG